MEWEYGRHPKGLANGSDMVGRHYMSHLNSVMLAVSLCPNPTIFQKTLALNDFYYGAEDWDHPMGHISFIGKTDADVLAAGAPKFSPGWYLAPPGRPRPADEKSYDLWFQHVAIIVSDMDRAYQALREARVQLVTPGPQRLPDWNPNAGGIRAMYFRDPDGHPLEILWFPPGKGAARWHQKSNRLFLGIDHTAIAVSNTEASLAFYRDVLGFEVAGHSENYGIEQERLNSVFGARLRITSVRAAAGPAIEFLEYLAPAGGRMMPADEKATDLIHWQTRLVTVDAEAVATATRAAGRTWVSPGVVRLSDDVLGFNNGFHVRDPDGHVMEVIER